MKVYHVKFEDDTEVRLGLFDKSEEIVLNKIAEDYCNYVLDVDPMNFEILSVKEVKDSSMHDFTNEVERNLQNVDKMGQMRGDGNERTKRGYRLY